MRRSCIVLLASVALLSSCLQDLEGGAARMQVRNTWSDTLRAVSIGSWKHEFDPLLPPGKLSETVELPVSGKFEIGVWGVRDGRDTLLCARRIDVGVGEFVRVE